MSSNFAESRQHEICPTSLIISDTPTKASTSQTRPYNRQIAYAHPRITVLVDYIQLSWKKPTERNIPSFLILQFGPTKQTIQQVKHIKSILGQPVFCRGLLCSLAIYACHLRFRFTILKMSITVKHLNSDTSFLLTLTPFAAFPTSLPSLRQYTIVLDPWLDGPSDVIHRKFSTTRHKTPSHITSLTELPEPDMVIISQSKSDHCHKQTLTQLLPSGKTTIYAEPGAAKMIRGWKHFAPDKVITLQRWVEPKIKKNSKGQNLHTIPIAPQFEDGIAGKIDIALLAQKPDITGLHNAIVLTYQSPTSSYRPTSSTGSQVMTPASVYSTETDFTAATAVSRQHYTPPVSLLYSPHGLPYKVISRYVPHLRRRGALPLSVLLHSFDSVSNPWYLGGSICSGFPGGKEIAEKLSATVWISAHDGDKEIKGIANGGLQITKYGISEVESIMSPRSDKFPANKELGTKMVVLGVGEEYMVDGMNEIWKDDCPPRK